MDDHPTMRASDADRQEVIERLRTALDEGRLKMDEYLERMGQASEAVTYGDLTPLCADLPESGPVARREPAGPAAAPPQAAPPQAAPPQAAPPQAAPPQAAPSPTATQAGAVARHGFAALPTPLKVLWTIWGAVVSVNLVVWVLVSATTAQLIYPWPLWVAGPWGAILLAVSVAVVAGRRGGQPR